MIVSELPQSRPLLAQLLLVRLRHSDSIRAYLYMLHLHLPAAMNIPMYSHRELSSALYGAFELEAVMRKGVQG